MKYDCPAWASWLVLIVGILYLLTDLTMIFWWNIQWYTVLFLLWGLMAVGGESSRSAGMAKRK